MPRVCESLGIDSKGVTSHGVTRMAATQCVLIGQWILTGQWILIGQWKNPRTRKRLTSLIIGDENKEEQASPK